MSKSYIVDRLLPKIIKDICHEQKIKITSYSDDWILRLEKNDKTKWIVSSQFDINQAAASDVVADKVACYLTLADQNIPTVEHRLMRIIVSPEVLHTNFAHFPTDKPVVVKPLRGNGGREIMKFSSPSDAVIAIENHPHPEWCISPWYDVTKETRVIVLSGRVVLTYDKTSQIHNDLKMFNLSQGNQAEVATVDHATCQLALRSAKAIGLRVCAVDIVTLVNGSQLVLEINDHFGMEYFARQSSEHYQITYQLYESIVMEMLEERSKVTS